MVLRRPLDGLRLEDRLPEAQQTRSEAVQAAPGPDGAVAGMERLVRDEGRDRGPRWKRDASQLGSQLLPDTAVLPRARPPNRGRARTREVGETPKRRLNHCGIAGRSPHLGSANHHERVMTIARPAARSMNAKLGVQIYCGGWTGGPARWSTLGQYLTLCRYSVDSTRSVNSSRSPTLSASTARTSAGVAKKNSLREFTQLRR